MKKQYFYGKEITEDHPRYNKSREGTTSGLHRRVENIVSFWTKKEYDLQELIVQGFVVHREIPGQSLRTKPFARIEIWYDSPNGIGRKAINGVEEEVLKEAQKYLSPGELDLLNDNWIKAKFEGKYKWNDPFCRFPIYDKTLPPWIIGKKLEAGYKKELLQNKKKYVEQKLNDQIKDSASSLNKRINDFLKEIHYKERKDKVKTSPLQDIIRTKDIDPKDVVGDDNLSTLYKHIKGDKELSKTKALDYAKTLGVAPGTLMFEPKTINVWSNVKLSDKIEAPDGSVAILPGECYEKLRTELTVCPSELYRLDIKAIKINDPGSIYDGFMAYYYATDKVSEAANNKLCMVRTREKGKTLLGGHYKYYLGIFQIFGTKKMIVNVDPLSENRIIADDIVPDAVAPIVSFTRPSAIIADKVLSKNIKQVQLLGQLIRKEQAKRNEIFDPAVSGPKYFFQSLENDPEFAKKLEETNKKFEAATAEVKAKIKELETKIEAQKRERKTRLFNIPGLLANDDDYEVPNFLRKEEKKRA